MKHRAIIFVKAEVQDMIGPHECSGRVKYQIKQFPLFVDGEDEQDAVMKLNEILEELKQRCQTKSS